MIKILEDDHGGAVIVIGDVFGEEETICIDDITRSNSINQALGELGDSIMDKAFHKIVEKFYGNMENYHAWVDGKKQ